MKEREALDLAKQLVEIYHWRFTDSAKVGMRAHAIRSSDVREIILNAESCDAQDDGCSWRVSGEAFSLAEECRVVFGFQNDAQTVVISAHRLLGRQP